MKFNKNDIEYYLLSKDYQSLTKDELKIVNKAVESEAEYSSLRQLLLAMEETSEKDLITPDPKIKEALVSTFEKVRWKKGVETSDAVKVVSLNEENSKRRGGLVWLSVAAAIALLIGVFVTKDTLFSDSNNQMAKLENEGKTEKEIEEALLEDKKTDNKETRNSENEIEPDVIEDSFTEEASDFSSSITKEEENKSDNSIVNEKGDVFVGSNSVPNEYEPSSTNIEFDEDEKKERSIVDFDSNDLISQDLNKDSDSYGSSTDIDFESADEEVVETESLSLDDLEVENDKAFVSTNNSKSLKDDKEMIALLYTAL